MAETYSAGVVTAYGAAVRGGYTGTYEQFCAEQASFAASARQVAEDRAAVEQLAETFEDQTVPAAVGQVNQAGAAQVQAVQAAGADEESDISAAGTTQVQAVQAAGSTQVQAVQTAGAAQVTAVQGEGSTQVAAVNAAGATQVDAVEDKGEEVLASIPQDYSALSGEVDDLKSAFDEALSPSTGLRNLCTGIQKGKYWVAWNSGDTVTLTDNANYMAATVPLSGAEHITLNWNWDGNSFSFFADADNKRIALMRDYLYNGLNYVYTVPEGAVYAYISQNIANDPALTYINTIGVVALDGTNVIGTEVTISDYPYGGTGDTVYHADDLVLSTAGSEALKDIIPPLVGLDEKVIKSVSTIYGKSGLADFNDAPNNSLITCLIPASTAPADLPANYPVGHVIKGVGQLVTYISSNSNIKIQTYRNAVQGLTYTRQYTVGDGWQAWYQPNVKKRYTCLKNGSGDFSSLVTAINTVCEEMDAELFVGPGTWDIISELGADYMNAVSSSSSTWGLVLKNRIHIICSANSLITAKYTGSNTNVKTYFSAFNAGEYGFTLENANIETDNVRYTVHDDRGGGGGEGYYNRYINCSMKHTNGMYTDCIGGGLGTNGLIEIINCYFEGDANATRLAYYHGNNYSGQTNAQCKLIVKGNYFAGLGTFGLTKYGDSTKVSTAYVSNNSIGSALFVNSGSYAPQDNMRMIEWNNVVRS